MATVVLTPLLLEGNVAGHDIHYHLSWWMEAARQWREGTLYPRWYGAAYHGFGDATFLVYPPASWMLGAALGTIFPWPVVPGIFSWLALTLGGLAMHHLAREWLGKSQSLWAAALYVANPYNLLVVYHRTAYAELLAAAVFPLVVLFTLRLARLDVAGPSAKSSQNILSLAAALAAISLTNAPAAVITSYAVALLLAVEALRRRSAAPLVRGALAGGLGLALAGVYVVPAVVEQHWVQMREELVTGMGPMDNFLFTYTGFPLHDNFNLLVSVISCVVLPMAAVAFFAAFRAARRSASNVFGVLVPLLCLTIAAAGLLWSASAPVWRVVPQLEFVQFPWRGLFVVMLALVFAVAATAPRDRTWHAWSIGTAVGWLLLGTVVLLLAPWDAGGVRDFIALAGAGLDNRVLPAFAPAGSTPSKLRWGQAALLPPGNANLPADAHLVVERSRTEEKLISVESSVPVTIETGLLSYPAWQAEVNGNPVSTRTNPETGEMLVGVPAGRSRVRLFFARTPDRTAGGVISLLAVALGIALFFKGRSAGAVSEPSEPTSGS